MGQTKIISTRTKNISIMLNLNCTYRYHQTVLRQIRLRTILIFKLFKNSTVIDVDSFHKYRTEKRAIIIKRNLEDLRIIYN